MKFLPLLIAVLAPAAIFGETLDTVVFGNDVSEKAHAFATTGSAVFQNELTLSGPGNIWDKEDVLVYRHQSLTGDGWIETRVTSTGSANGWTKIGVMMRESLAADSKNAFMFHTTSQGLHAQWRGDTGGGTGQSEEIKLPASPPYRVRAERKGDTFTLSAAADGKEWSVVKTLEIPMARGIFMGLVNSSSSTEKVNHATFDDIRSSAGKSEWKDTVIGKTKLAGSSMVNGLGETSRRMTPLVPNDYYGGEITLKMKVHPTAQNYCTVKLWGSEGAAGRIVLTCEDREIGQRHGAGAEIFIGGGDPVSPGAFWYRTTILPKWLTEGKSEVTLRLRSTGSFYAYGAVWNYDTYQKKMDRPSRALYRLYTHTNPVLVPAGETQGKTPSYATAPVKELDKENALADFKAQTNKKLGEFMKRDKLGEHDLEFLANAYDVPWTDVYQNPAVVACLVKIIDKACRDFTADPRKAGGEWGGAYGAHGVAVLRIVKAIKPALDERVDFGAGSRPRREYWENLLVASRDFGRGDRKTITNQALFCDANIYRANRGLLALGSSKALTEEEARRYLHEAAGLVPYTYSEDGNGKTKPVDEPNTHRMVAAKGTTHEWNWCCHNCYGGMGSYVFEMARLSGDTALRDQAVTMENAHISQLYPSTDPEGYRAMLNEGVICTRNVYHPGKPGYPYINIAASLRDKRLANGVRQQLMDGQLFSAVKHGEATIYLPDDLEKIENALAKVPFTPLPTSPGQPDFAWADEQNAVLTIKHGADIHFITFARRSEHGLFGIGDVHSITPGFERVIQYAVEDIRFKKTGKTNKIGPEVQTPFTGKPPDGPINAWADRELPQMPGRPGSPAGFYGTRFGEFVIGMNSSYGETYDFKPDGFTRGLDLISGKMLSAPLRVPPQTTIVIHSPIHQ